MTPAYPFWRKQRTVAWQRNTTSRRWSRAATVSVAQALAFPSNATRQWAALPISRPSSGHT